MTAEGCSEAMLVKLLPSLRRHAASGTPHHSCEQGQQDAAKASCRHQTANENQNCQLLHNETTTPEGTNSERETLLLGTGFLGGESPKQACLRDHQPEQDT